LSDSAALTFRSRVGANQRVRTQPRIACWAPLRSMPNGTTPSGATCSARSTSATIGAPQNGHDVARSSVWVVAAHFGQVSVWLPSLAVALIGDDCHAM
jgi:hypothetical protein